MELFLPDASLWSAPVALFCLIVFAVNFPMAPYLRRILLGLHHRGAAQPVKCISTQNIQLPHWRYNPALMCFQQWGDSTVKASMYPQYWWTMFFKSCTQVGTFQVEEQGNTRSEWRSYKGTLQNIIYLYCTVSMLRTQQKYGLQQCLHVANLGISSTAAIPAYNHARVVLIDSDGLTINFFENAMKPSAKHGCLSY